MKKNRGAIEGILIKECKCHRADRCVDEAGKHHVKCTNAQMAGLKVGHQDPLGMKEDCHKFLINTLLADVLILY